jgi:hypothetical protein
MRIVENGTDTLLSVGYGWKYKGRWNELSAKAGLPAHPLTTGSKEEFIAEHFMDRFFLSWLTARRNRCFWQKDRR